MIIPLVEGYSSSEEEAEFVGVVNAPEKVLVSAKLPPNVEAPSNKRENDFKRRGKELKKQRKSGPWGGYETDDTDNERISDTVSGDIEILVGDTVEVTAKAGDDDVVAGEVSDSGSESEQFSSKFVGKSKVDYLNRPYTHFQPVTSHPNFCPKKINYTLPGHPKGVTKLAFFPVLGHLLLSSGNDSTIKLWNTSTKELLRIFNGHDKAVKDIVFNPTGSHFISCGYDKRIQIWNTETGEITRTINVRSFPHCLLYHPNSNEFLVGLANHNIEHYDINGTLVQTYTHHLGLITSLTNIGNSFMLTADDKSVRMWDWQINIPTKSILDPSQHAMPSAAVHPDAYIALQGMDNKVHVIQGSGKYKFNRQKTFTGHNVAGYGVQIDISPDGKILMSGDSHGNAFFWDWKSRRIVRKIKLSEKLVQCIRVHPCESSIVAAAGSSGDIYLLE